jgi:hypothetical protein
MTTIVHSCEGMLVEGDRCTAALASTEIGNGHP